MTMKKIVTDYARRQKRDAILDAVSIALIFGVVLAVLGKAIYAAFLLD